MAPAPVRIPTSRTPPTDAALVRGTATAANCTDCPFATAGKPTAPVFGIGPQDPAWILWGEGPGQNEVRSGIPFTGASGEMVNRMLRLIKADRNRLWIGNSTLCLPPRNAPDGPRKAARDCCRERVNAELRRFPKIPLLAMGAVAAQGFLGDKFSITQMAGSYHEVDLDGTGPRGIIPTIHPAAILRGGAGDGGGAHAVDLLFWNLVYDGQKVSRLAAGTAHKWTDDFTTETTNPARALQLVIGIVREAERLGVIACDTETYVTDEEREQGWSALQPEHARLTAIGLATPLRAVSIAWALVTPPMRTWIARVMADARVRKVFHNALYDVPVLRCKGFPVKGRVDDTLIMHHNAFPGGAHGLQAVACQLFIMPPWKAEFRGGEGSIGELTTYNARDVLATARLDPSLQAFVDLTDSRRTYEVDLDMIRVADQMSRMGVPVSCDINSALGDRFGAALRRARSEIEAKAYDDAVWPKLVANLAKEQAKRFRKGDPVDYPTRIAVREREIAAQPNRVFLINSGEHVAAFLKARGVALYAETEKGRVSTKKDLLEGMRSNPEVAALLEYREASKMYSTFVVKIVKDLDDAMRFHSRWSIHKITGRWSAEAPQCFDGATEILTESGWVRFDALEKDARVAQYHAETGAIDFVAPTAHIHHGPVSTLLEITQKQAHLNLRCTPDHRLLVVHRKTGRRSVVCAKDLPSEHKIPAAGRYVGGKISRSWAWIAFFCAAQADGTWNGHGWRFTFTRPRKIARLREALDALALPYSVKDSTQASPFDGRLRARTAIYVQRCDVGDEIADWLVSGGTWHKHLLIGSHKAFGPRLLGFDRATLDLFVDEVWNWDGAYTRQTQYASSVRACADWVQIALTLSGRRARLRAYTGSALQKAVNWQVDATRTRWTGTARATKTVVEHGADVYCVTVPSTFIIVRSGPNALIVGNCQNWPKEDLRRGRPNMRTQVIAPPKRKFIGFDYSQLEARLIALGSGDAFLVKVFAEDRDLHSEIARIVFPDFDRFDPDRRKKLRDTVKRPEYGAFYGGDVETLYKAVVVDHPDIKMQDLVRMVQTMKKYMPGVDRWHDELLREVQVKNELRSVVYGRRRCFPLGNASPSEVFNFPVQCLAEGQKVLTTSGWVPVEKLQPREHLLVQYTSPTANYRVHDRGVQDVFRLETTGSQVVATARHRFLAYTAETGEACVTWRRLEELHPGDLVAVHTVGMRAHAWLLVRVEAITPAGAAPTYDLEIDGNDHGYVAEGLITHNSSGADVMATGIMKIMPRLPPSAFPILQIHDAMIFECDETDAEWLRDLVVECFTQEHTNPKKGVTVKFPIDARIGDSWAEADDGQKCNCAVCPSCNTVFNRKKQDKCPKCGVSRDSCAWPSAARETWVQRNFCLHCFRFRKEPA